MYKHPSSACTLVGMSLVLWHIVALLLGLAMSGTGVYLFYKDTLCYPYLDVIKDMLVDLRIVLVALGAVVVLLSIICIAGVFCKQKFLLQLYCYIEIFLLLAQFGLSLFTFLNKDNLVILAEHECQMMISRYGENTLKTDLVDQVQDLLQCCGCTAKGHEDYSRSPVPDLPPSCFHNSTFDISETSGCVPAILNVLETKHLYVILCGVMSTVVQLTVVILVNCHMIQHLQYKYNYPKSNRVSPSPTSSLEGGPCLSPRVNGGPGRVSHHRHGDVIQREQSF